MTEPMKTENERFNLYLHDQDDGIKKWLKDVSESDYDLVSKFERGEVKMKTTVEKIKSLIDKI